MTSTPKVELAKELAREAHAGQVDKAGAPYIEHLEYVADKLMMEDEKIVAYLHDILEDTDAREEDLRDLFDSNIVDAVIAITKRAGESYASYLERVKNNHLSRIVKLSDLSHNMMIERLPRPTKEDYERIRKYKEAFDYLLE